MNRKAAFAAVVAAAALAWGALPAFAAASSSTVSQQPADGAASQSSYPANLTLALDAHVTRSCSGLACSDSGAPVSLLLRDPAGCTRTLGTTSSSSQTSLSADLDTGDATLPAGGSCAAVTNTPVANGTWVLSLSGDGADAATSFTLRIPPATPRGVSASPASDTSASVTWAANTEPDLVSYAVLDSRGQPLIADVSPRTACSGGSCAVTVTYPSSAAAGSHQIEITASRSAGPGTNQTLASPPSAPVAVTLSGPPGSTPSPSPTAGSGGSSAGANSAGGGSGTTRTAAAAATRGPQPAGGGGGGTALQPAQVVALGFSSFAPPPGIAKLPPLPVLAAPGTTEPTTAGTYAPTLQYPAQYHVTRVRRPTGALHFSNDVTSVLPARELWTAVAGALLLLLAAFHLQAYLRHLAR